MRLEQLEYLVAVANDHSMHTASHNLHVSQQNISKAIRQLEDELHTQLFDRTNRGVQLTTDGQKVYTYALNITNQINALRQEFCPSPHAAALTGNITIYLSSGLPHFIDTPLKLLCSQYPALSPILIERDSFDLLNELPQILPEIAIIQLTRQKLLANAQSLSPLPDRRRSDPRLHESRSQVRQCQIHFFKNFIHNAFMYQYRFSEQTAHLCSDTVRPQCTIKYQVHH